MRFLKLTFILAFFSLTGIMNAQQTPAPEQSGTISITGATAHIGNGELIENSLIIFKDGKITTVAKVSEAEAEGKVIEAEGKHVYPGIIAPNATLGLVEIDAVRATDDEDEIGTMLPHVRSIIAYNAESKIVESMRPNGVLLGQIVPRGGRISGTSSVVQFDAWNWEDAVMKEDGGIHINWPASFKRGRWWMGEERGMHPNKEYEKQVMELSDFLASSKAYLNGERKMKHLPYLSMEGTFNGKKTIYVHLDGEKEMLDAIQFKKDNGIEKMVFVGGYKALEIADQLKENDIAVLVDRPHNLPNQDFQDYDAPYRLATQLYNKGVLVAIQSAGRMERMNTRNLPFYAGTAAAYGLDKEDALKLITSNSAKILGIDDKVGTLEEGKDATLFISEGDALDMRTNILSNAFIQGRELSLETHQTELWKRYMNKYEDQKTSGEDAPAEEAESTQSK